MANPSENGPAVRIVALGDISLNGSYCDPQHHEIVRANLADISARLGPADLRLGNLESPMWGDGSVNTLKEPRLAMTDEAAECLVPLGLDVAVLANNHICDNLRVGFERTVDFLGRHGIAWVGAGRSPEEARKPLVLERGGLRIGILAYVSQETNPKVPQDTEVHVNFLEAKRAVEETRRLTAEVDVTIIYLHWSGWELIRYPHPSQRALAHELAEAGASLILGGHAHCLQGHESHQGSAIFYSMGNFLFGDFAAHPGKWGHRWPKHANRVGVAVCDVGADGVRQSRLEPLIQRELTLEPEAPAARSRMQARLNRALQWSDRKLMKRWRREVLWQRTVNQALYVIRTRGLGKLFAIRGGHFRIFKQVLKQLHVANPGSAGRTAQRTTTGKDTRDR